MNIRRNESAAASGDGAPIDLEHLTRQTQGDAELAREVLALFANQVLSIRSELEGADAERRSSLAHSLVGASRAIGAFALADAAAALEAKPQSGQNLELLALRIDEVSAFMSERLG